MTSEEMTSLQPALCELLEELKDCFHCGKTLGHLETYVAGLLTDIKRKSVEPIALAAGVPVRTLQEFLADYEWNHARVEVRLHHWVADRHAATESIGVVDASAHVKQGKKTPGVRRQWCGETGKVENCVVGQHLLYTDNDPVNPFRCVLASDLFLPEEWAKDRDRCRAAGIPDDLEHRPKWKMAADQIERAIGNGVRFTYLTFDEDYGQVPEFWFALDRLGQVGVGEVRKNFRCWVTTPSCVSLRVEHAAKRVDNLAERSAVFREQAWTKVHVKNTTRGKSRWKYKAARVQLTDTRGSKTVPTDRRYWLIVAQSADGKETKYIVSNAGADAKVEKLLWVAFSRWHVEKWFEHAKQETGFGAFEVRTYTGLIRHWLSSRLAMYFLASQTKRLREKKSGDHSRAGGQHRQHPGREDLATVHAVVGSDRGQQRVLQVA